MFAGSRYSILANDDLRSHSVEDTLGIDGILRLCCQGRCSLGGIVCLVVGINPRAVGGAIRIFRDSKYLAVR